MATQVECAVHLDLSERRFRELVADGTISEAGKGAYNLDTVRIEYIRHLREAAAGRTPSNEDAANKAFEDARRAKAVADKAEMEVAKMRGQLIPADQVAETLHNAVSIMKTRIMAVPTKAAARCGAKNVAAAEKVIREEVVDALAELAQVEVAGTPAA